MQIIRIDSNTKQQIVASIIAGRKIQAIKILKTEGNKWLPTEKIGLREAKLAVERLMVEIGRANPGVRAHPEAPRIKCGPQIKQVVFDFGTGDIAVNLEEMQMTALMEMQNIGLDSCKEILDLVEVFKAIEEGKEIKIIDKPVMIDPELEEFGRGIADI